MSVSFRNETAKALDFSMVQHQRTNLVPFDAEGKVMNKSAKKKA